MAGVMAASQVAPRVEELIAESRFSGVVRIDRAGETVLEHAAGWAHRAYRVPTRVDTRLAVASGSKVFTAAVVLSLAGPQSHSLSHLEVRDEGLCSVTVLRGR